MYYFPVNLFLVSLRGREHRGMCRGPSRPPAHSIPAGPGAPTAGRMLGPGPPDGSRREFWQWKQEEVSATAPKYVFTARSTGSAAFEQRKNKVPQEDCVLPGAQSTLSHLHFCIVPAVTSL